MAEADFEAPLVELQKRIGELARWPGDPDKEQQARRLREELDEAAQVFAQLSPWQKTLVARNPNRPYTLDVVQALFTEWTEVKARPALRGRSGPRVRLRVLPGRAGVRDRAPEGPRHQAEDPPQLACRSRRTTARPCEIRAARSEVSPPDPHLRGHAGAYPGSTRRSAAGRAIAFNLREMAALRTPIIVTVTGEGGSGGALAIAVGDRVNIGHSTSPAPSSRPRGARRSCSATPPAPRRRPSR
ncbi:MAG: hypothetical protein U0599_04045 [Vicinamibacteria bacterium]